MWERDRLTGDVAAAAAAIGVDRTTVRDWIWQQGGLRPRFSVLVAPAAGCRLSFEERVHVEIGLGRGESLRMLAGRLGRAPSTISREVRRHRLGGGRYSAAHAQRVAWQAPARPQPLELGGAAAAVGLRRPGGAAMGP